MSRSRGPYRSYTPHERHQALLQLALNGGNLQKTARETGIPVVTLLNWRDSHFKEFMVAQFEEMEKFIKDCWENIHTLNDPELIRSLKVKVLERGCLKEIATYTAVMIDKMLAVLALLSTVSKDTGPHRSSEDLTDEELGQLIAEEEEKERKRRQETGGSEEFQTS